MNALQTKNHRLFRPVTLRRLLQAAALLAVGMFVVYSIRWSPRVTHGFAMYYTYSRMVLEGIDFHTAYDYDSFNARIEEFGMAGTRDMPNNLPTNALTFLGIAWLPPGMARIVWLAASLLLLGASVRILFSLYGLTPHETLGLVSIILVCTWRPNYDCIALGQLYILLLFFFSLSLWGVRGEKATATALPVSAALLSKGYGFVPLIWMARQREWRATGIVVLVVVAVVLVTLPLFGSSSWSAFFNATVLRLGSHPMNGHVAFQTIHSWLLHLFLFDPEWLPRPIVALPAGLVMTLSIIVNGFLVLYTVTRAPRQGNPESRVLAYSAVIACSVVTAPLAEEYHFVLFLPLVLGLWTAVFRKDASLPRRCALQGVVVVSSLIVAAPLPYKALNDSPFPLSLLAYPKLYAGIVLLICFGMIVRPIQRN